MTVWWRIIVRIWRDIDIYAMWLFFFGKLCFFYYTHPSYRTSVVGKNYAYYIQIFTVLMIKIVMMMTMIVLLWRCVVDGHVPPVNVIHNAQMDSNVHSCFRKTPTAHSSKVLNSVRSVMNRWTACVKSVLLFVSLSVEKRVEVTDLWGWFLWDMVKGCVEVEIWCEVTWKRETWFHSVEIRCETTHELRVYTVTFHLRWL